ncbi:MAG TPA: APC family permease [Ktedonobacteraceae bacterium]|nr:APC family permease [Ktedonobacteraceae bacterium]
MSDLADNITGAQTSTQDTALRKNSLGLSEVLFQSITSMAPASAVCASLPPAVPLAGAALPISVVMATIACTLIASSIGQLAIHIPSAGGLYTYISRSLGDRLGFMGAWAFLLAQPLLLPLVALIWGPYLEILVKTLTGVDINWIVWVVLGHIGLSLLTYYGIQLSTKTSVVLGIIEIIVILALSFTMIFGAPNDLATFTPIYAPHGWNSIFQGLIFVFLAFVGFEASAPLGEETANPKRNIPRAMIYSALGIGIFYVLAAYASVIGWGIPKIGAFGNSAAPWNDLAQKFWGGIGPIIITFALINSTLANGNAGINATTRVMYAMGRIGSLPRGFARLSAYQTPTIGIAVQSIGSLVIALGTGLIFGTTNAFGLVGTVIAINMALLYITSCISSFVFYRRERRQDFRVVQHVIVPLIPLILLCFVLYAQVIPVPPYPLNLAAPIVVIWLVLGALYMLYLQRTNPAALKQGKETFLNDQESEPVDLGQALL